MAPSDHHALRAIRAYLRAVTEGHPPASALAVACAAYRVAYPHWPEDRLRTAVSRLLAETFRTHLSVALH